MKAFLLTSLVFLLLLVSTPVKAGNWAEDFFSWVSEWFSDEETSSTTFTPKQLDSLRATPLGLLLSGVPQTDTLAVDGAWPYESLTVESDIERHLRLLRQTVVLANPNSSLPFRGTPAVRIIYRPDQRPARLIAMARRFADVQEIPFDETIPHLLPSVEDIPTVIVVDNPMGLSPMNADWFRPLENVVDKKTTFLHFGRPDRITELPKEWAVISCPLRSKESEAFLGQALFGAQLLDGRLAEKTNAYRAGAGQRLEAVIGGFHLPELFGIDRQKFERVDYHINRGIRYRAMPGAQLLVMKDGQVVYEKAYGHHTYHKQKVAPGDLYDLASITKAAATSLAIMKLYDDGKIDLQAQVREYLPELKKKMIGRYSIEQLLTHHSGIQSDLPLDGLLGRQFVADEVREEYTIPVGPDRYLDETIPGKIRKRLAGKISRTRRPTYRYSDVNYYLLQLAIEEITGEQMEDFLEREFYQPMELGKLGFNPSEKFPSERLVPTVYDRWMRGGLLRGYVHDEGAALLGGVAGHAGLFGNARDLGQLFQLMNDGGEYAGQQLLTPETVELFTSRSRYNYRALGFDRLAAGWPNLISAGASNKTFGHLGFTGTSVWADPENDLVFVLLTNRVFPHVKSNKFSRMQIRGKVHQAVYQALETWNMES